MLVPVEHYFPLASFGLVQVPESIIFNDIVGTLSIYFADCLVDVCFQKRQEESRKME